MQQNCCIREKCGRKTKRGAKAPKERQCGL
jgi:hypothetical protein